MLTIAIIAIAAFFNAVQDSCDSGHYWGTIFSKWNPKFWHKDESWKYAKMIGGYRLDAWHLAKSATLVCLVASVVSYKGIIGWWVDFVILGLVWNIVFNTFYNHLLKTKKK
jgi:hypothetical protein